MEWRDEGIILGVKRHGETGAIVEVMTRGHGRHLGMVRGGRSRKVQPTLQPGNRVDVVWRARLDEHLGNFSIEPLDLQAARLLDSPTGMFGIQLLAAHLRLLPERDPHPALFETLGIIVSHLDRPDLGGALMVRFEIALLDELGFGLDLSACAATGRRDDLAYVSPKSGRAVSREAGQPWADRMLPLPLFVTNDRDATADVGDVEIAQAFRLTRHFLLRDVWGPRGIEEPFARGAFMAAIARALQERKAP